MSEEQLSHEMILQRFVLWAQQQEDIRVAFVIGSRARNNHPADKWADLDLIFVTTNPYHYILKADWLETFGALWLTYVEKNNVEGIMERRALFAGGVDVDFVPIALKDMQKFAAIDMLPLEDVLLPGVKIVLDKDNFAEIISDAREVLAQHPTLSIPPGNNEFIESIHNFWYHFYWTAKKLCRGELWSAKWCLDVHMKLLLLRMLEWYKRAMHGWDYNTWHNGRYLEEWAGSRVIEELQDAFAHYSTEDMWQALKTTQKLYRWVAKETAQLLSYTYPTRIDEQVSILVTTYQTTNS